MSYAIECRNLWKSYARPAHIGVKALLLGQRATHESRYVRQWALRDVSFRVARGQAFGIVGHNGTGKTTLLSILLGALQPDRGELSVRGRLAPLIELAAGFHPELTGRENVYLFGSILGMRLHEISERFERIVEFSEIEDAIEAPLRTFSSGMITRLSFSTIIHAAADILLIDEVLAVGDARFQERCFAFLKDFKARNGTLVIVSHNTSSLARICDEGMCLELGGVAALGVLPEVLQYYEKLTPARAQATKAAEAR